MPTFFLQRPVHAFTLDSWLGTIGLDVMQTPRPKFYLNQYRVRWTCPAVVHGPIDMVALKTFVLEGKPRKRASKPRGVRPSGVPAIADSQEDDDDQACWDLLGDIAQAGAGAEQGSDGDFKCECSEAGSESEDHHDLDLPPPQPDLAPGPSLPVPGPSPPHLHQASAPRPPPHQEGFKCIAVEDRHRVAQAIIKAAVKKVRAYKAAVTQASSQVKDVGSSQISLIRSDVRVGVVSWTTPETLQGVNIDIDESNKAISQCGWAAPVNYFDAPILIHAVAVVYEHRCPKHLRPLIPDWCMAIFMVQHAHVSPGPYTITRKSVNRLSCIRCACVKDLGRLSSAASRGGAFKLYLQSM